MNKSAQSNLGRGPHRRESKSPVVTTARPTFAPKVPLPMDRSPNPTICHPWTRPTYDAKWHPDLIRRFSTMHWTDRRTDRPTDRPRESLIAINRCAPRSMRPKNYAAFSQTDPCWGMFGPGQWVQRENHRGPFSLSLCSLCDR